MNDPIDVWAAIDEERRALVADLARIDAGQWETPSLCAEWKVRDVVGHLVFPTNLQEQLADTIGSRNLPPFVKSACELADIVCHGEDIRGPLGVHRDALDELSGAGLDDLRTRMGAV